MTATTFDKLAYIDSLQANGVAEDQARAHAVALNAALHEAVATKVDMADVKGLIADVRSEISESRSEMRTAFADVRTEIATSKSDMTRLMLVMFFGLAGLMVALLKLL